MPAQPQNLAAFQTALNRFCRNPLRLRIALAAALAGGWYLALYRPLVGRIAAAHERLDTERKRIAVAEVIEDLKAETKRFNDRLPPRPDPNESIQYLLDGVKARPAVRLLSLTPTATKEMGPFQTVGVRLTAEATYPELDRLLRWLEQNPRIFRVEEITIGPVESSGPQRRQGGPVAAPQYSMELTILGVIG